MGDTWEFKIDDNTLAWLRDLAKFKHNDICLSDGDSAQIILLMLRQRSHMEMFVRDMIWRADTLVGIIEKHVSPEEMSVEEQRCYEHAMMTKDRREKARLAWADRNATSDVCPNDSECMKDVEPRPKRPCLDHWLRIHDEGKLPNTRKRDEVEAFLRDEYNKFKGLLRLFGASHDSDDEHSPPYMVQECVCNIIHELQDLLDRHIGDLYAADETTKQMEQK